MPADYSSNTCQKCGQKTATYHICYGNSEPALDLCEDCLKLEDGYIASYTQELKSASCHFCGGSACTGGTNILGQLTAPSQQHLWMCTPCAQEYYRTTSRLLEHIPSGLTTPEHMEKIKEIAHQTQAHMQHFANCRRN